MPNEDRHILVLSYMQVTGSRLEYGGACLLCPISVSPPYIMLYTLMAVCRFSAFSI